MVIFVIGGTSYIGSHTVLMLLERGDDVAIIDNLANASRISLDRVAGFTGREPIVYIADVPGRQALKNIFVDHNTTDVIHFAGFKSVSESIEEPLAYYENNITRTLVLLDEIPTAGVNRFIFGPSTTVYGSPESIPLSKQSRTGGTTNPYGTSRSMVRQILADFSHTRPDFRITCLRYFNPVGTHPPDRISENPNDILNNLVPCIPQATIGEPETVSMYGNGYPTPDDAGVRDCTRIVDLATGHLAAPDCQDRGATHEVTNLGTGVGYSVINLIEVLEKVAQTKINYQFVVRRPGDTTECWSDPSLVYKELGWKAIYNLDEMMRDTWSRQKNNPNGYQI